jgi:hypothetical protein
MRRSPRFPLTTRRIFSGGSTCSIRALVRAMGGSASLAAEAGNDFPICEGISGRHEVRYSEPAWWGQRSLARVRSSEPPGTLRRWVKQGSYFRPVPERSLLAARPGTSASAESGATNEFSRSDQTGRFACLLLPNGRMRLPPFESMMKNSERVGSKMAMSVLPSPS